MKVWVDVRVSLDDLGTLGMEGLLRMRHECNLVKLDLQPNATGPEAELTFLSSMKPYYAESHCENFCAAAGLEPLAVRSRVE